MQDIIQNVYEDGIDHCANVVTYVSREDEEDRCRDYCLYNCQLDSEWSFFKDFLANLPDPEDLNLDSETDLRVQFEKAIPGINLIDKKMYLTKMLFSLHDYVANFNWGFNMGAEGIEREDHQDMRYDTLINLLLDILNPDKDVLSLCYVAECWVKDHYLNEKSPLLWLNYDLEFELLKSSEQLSSFSDLEAQWLEWNGYQVDSKMINVF